MTTLKGSVTEQVECAPADMFAFVTDIDRLPEWNQLIQRVVERPAEVASGAEWVVEMQLMGSRWNSRSRVDEHDQGTSRFAYRSQSDDGNPSYALWTWTVTGRPSGPSDVAVTWELHPQTFWRKTLLARIRQRQLAEEVRASIHAAERSLASAAS